MPSPRLTRMAHIHIYNIPRNLCSYPYWVRKLITCWVTYTDSGDQTASAPEPRLSIVFADPVAERDLNAHVRAFATTGKPAARADLEAPGATPITPITLRR
jgi:hypothetical protein